MTLPDEERLKRGRAAVIDCSDPACDICLSVCGFSAIRPENGRPYSDPAKCIGCGGCAAACPEKRIFLIKDRGGDEYEVTLPFDGGLPDIDDVLENGLRVTQVIPQRPGTAHALVRGVMKANDFRKEFSK